MIEKELKEFINKYIGSLLEWDLVLHIYNNEMILKDKEFAQLFGYSEIEIKDALKKLTNDGLIRTDSSVGNGSVIPPELGAKVATLIDVLDHRRQRMAILSSVLQNEHTFF